MHRRQPIKRAHDGSALLRRRRRRLRERQLRGRPKQSPVLDLSLGCKCFLFSIPGTKVKVEYVNAQWSNGPYFIWRYHEQEQIVEVRAKTQIKAYQFNPATRWWQDFGTNQPDSAILTPCGLSGMAPVPMAFVQPDGRLQRAVLGPDGAAYPVVHRATSPVDGTELAWETTETLPFELSVVLTVIYQHYETFAFSSGFTKNQVIHRQVVGLELLRHLNSTDVLGLVLSYVQF